MQICHPFSRLELTTAPSFFYQKCHISFLLATISICQSIADVTDLTPAHTYPRTLLLHSFTAVATCVRVCRLWIHAPHCTHAGTHLHHRCAHATRLSLDSFMHTMLKLPYTDCMLIYSHRRTSSARVCTCH